MSFFRRIAPRRAVEDFAHEWRRPNPYRWRILAVSAAATFAMLVVLIPEGERVPPAPPEVTYITSFAPDRTDAEIIASNIENQRIKDQREAEAAAREERRRENFRALARATGLDADELERQYSDEPTEPRAAPQQAQAAGAE
jgi:hypothetical protein